MDLQPLVAKKGPENLKGGYDRELVHVNHLISDARERNAQKEN